MIVDPWGTVIAKAPDVVGIIWADIETDRVAAVRRNSCWPIGGQERIGVS